jgi:hypothetical protein
MHSSLCKFKIAEMRQLRRSIVLAMTVVFPSVAHLQAMAAPAHTDMSGRWELHADFDDRSIPGALANCTFKQEGERLSGTCEDASLIGEVKGQTVTLRLTPAGTHDTMIFTGMLDDDDTVVVGRFSYAGKGGGSFLAIKR